MGGADDTTDSGREGETRDAPRADDAGEREGPPTKTRRGVLAAGCALALGGFGTFESLFAGPDDEDQSTDDQDTETTTIGNDTTRFFDNGTTRFFDNGTTFFVDPDDRANRTYTTGFFNGTTNFFGTYTTDFLRTAGRRRRRGRWTTRYRRRRFRTFTTNFRRRRRGYGGTTVTFDDGFEPGDTPSGAEVLRPPVTFSGRISPAFDVDYFQFFARRGEQIILDPLTVTGPLIWSFLGPNLGLLTFGLRRTQLLVQNTGFQYLRIESRGNNIGRYTFRLWVRA
ncbi:hypothetical protein [Halorussus halophilus]|uniref:hypothetical protein n=1 Tax=Halorussus halophilus TaxID=2650975 RepID=UPI0013018B52|nr:hypothetical protein [Halorussus halophilus]